MRLRCEQVFRVAPLPLPDPDHLPGLSELEQVPLVALFLERARAIDPHFSIGPDNARAVAELCVRLDGLPLAIELAAARTDLLSPTMIVDRLRQRASRCSDRRLVTFPSGNGRCARPSTGASTSWTGESKRPSRAWASSSEYGGTFTHAIEGVVIRIAIVEDHPIVRQGLIAVLEDVEDFEITWTAGSAEEGLDLAARVPADVTLVDLVLPGMSGIDMIPLLVASPFGPRVLVFTAFAAQEQVLGAIKAGAAGYVLKGTDAADLIRAVRGVAGGGTVLEPLVAERVAAAIRAPRGAGTLTVREREVLQLLAGGLPGQADRPRVGHQRADGQVPRLRADPEAGGRQSRPGGRPGGQARTPRRGP